LTLSLTPRTRVIAVALFAAAAPIVLAGCPALLSWGLPAPGGNDATTAEEADDSDSAVPEAGADVFLEVGPSCNGVCVPTFDVSWTGPWVVTVLEAGAKATAPSCADGGAASLMFGGLTVPPASCSSCTCTVPEGTGCSPTAITVYSANGPACDSGLGTPIQLSDPGCTAIALETSDTFSILSSPEGCGLAVDPPSGFRPPATLETVAAACAAASPSGPCGNNGTCVPAPPQGSTVCVMQDGSAPQCPAGFSGPLAYSSDGQIDDTRSCSTCTCNPVPGSCTGDVDLFGDAGCTTTVDGLVAMPAQCISTLENAGAVTIVVAPTPAPDSCQPSTSPAGGSVTFTSPVTYCCL
jgi:hypothetical protein